MLTNEAYVPKSVVPMWFEEKISNTLDLPPLATQIANLKLQLDHLYVQKRHDEIVQLFNDKYKSDGAVLNLVLSPAAANNANPRKQFSSTTCIEIWETIIRTMAPRASCHGDCMQLLDSFDAHILQLEAPVNKDLTDASFLQREFAQRQQSSLVIQSKRRRLCYVLFSWEQRAVTLLAQQLPLQALCLLQRIMVCTDTSQFLNSAAVAEQQQQQQQQQQKQKQTSVGDWILFEEFHIAKRKSLSLWRLLLQCYQLLGKQECAEMCQMRCAHLGRFSFSECQSNHEKTKEVKAVADCAPPQQQLLLTVDDSVDVCFVNLYFLAPIFEQVKREQETMAKLQQQHSMGEKSKSKCDETPRSFDATLL